jgi:hypothetical protein
MAKDNEFGEKEAWEFYVQIRSVPCQKFGGEPIIFSRSGFKHLIWRGSKHRPKGEQKRRFALLLHAHSILTDPQIVPIRREGNDGVVFWGFTAVRDNKEITIVIRQIKGGRKHFFSIFQSRKRKIPSG